MEKRNWYPEFYQYMDEIVGHPNYQGLPITKKADGTWGWITTKKTRIGRARMAWCEAKARELGFEVKPGVYAKVMREIHPHQVEGLPDLRAETVHLLLPHCQYTKGPPAAIPYLL